MLKEIVEIYRYRGLTEHEVEFFKWLAEHEQSKRVAELERLNTLCVESLEKKSVQVAELESVSAAKDRYIDDLEAQIAELKKKPLYCPSCGTELE